jgi:hypothetical protein
MRKNLIKVMGITFVLALVLNVIGANYIVTENPPLHGANTITQIHIC